MRGTRSIGNQTITVILCDACGREDEKDDIVTRQSVWATSDFSVYYDLHRGCVTTIQVNIQKAFGIKSRQQLESKIRELISLRQDRVEQSEIRIDKL